MNLAFTNPGFLLLLPLALVPLIFAAQKAEGYPSLAGTETDSLSLFLDIGLRVAGAIAVVGLIVGIAGPYLKGQSIERTGKGAHIVLLMDRSSSLDWTFADRPPAKGEESKREIASRLLKDFVRQSEHDQIGVAGFSTMPALAVHITEHRDAVLAAINAMNRPGIEGTNVGRGLAMALAMIEQDVGATEPVIVLISDGRYGGAGFFDPKIQKVLRTKFAEIRPRLYWLFLRVPGDEDVLKPPPPGEPDTPRSKPERHMDLFFKSLGVRYRVFLADAPGAIEDAIREIRKLETRPVSYIERIPQKDLSDVAYATSAVAILILILAKLAEAPLSERVGDIRGAPNSWPAFRDPRFWLLVVAFASVISSLLVPRIQRARTAYDVLAIIDITRSMNVRDLTLVGKPASRLDVAKERLRQFVASMPCESKFGLGIFSERRVLILFEPIEVCANFASIDASIDALDWRMGWQGDSHIAEGVHAAIAVAASLDANLLFLTDGHEAPPLPWSGMRPFEGDPGKVRGLLVGVGGRTLSPIPKYDDEGREVGVLGPEDVQQENRSGLPPPDAEKRPGYHPKWAPFGAAQPGGTQHLSSVKEDHLRALGSQTGLAYTYLDGADGLLASFEAVARPRQVVVAVDMRPYPAGIALVVLLIVCGALPISQRFSFGAVGLVRKIAPQLR